MEFHQAFDPIRALGEAWRVLSKAPLAMLVGGSLLTLLGGYETSTSFENVEEIARSFAWDDVFELALVALIGGASCIVGVLQFLLACCLAATFPRAVERVVTTGEERLSDLIAPAGRFVPMLLVQLACFAIEVLVWAPVVLVGATAVGLGHALDLPVLGVIAAGALALVCIPLWVYVHLGLRLSEAAVALEDLDPIAAIRRSWDLVRGNRLQLFLYLVVLAVFEWLGLFLCCIGVLATGTLRRIAIAESFLQLVRPDERMADSWLARGDVLGPPAAGGGSPS